MLRHVVCTSKPLNLVGGLEGDTRAFPVWLRAAAPASCTCVLIKCATTRARVQAAISQDAETGEGSGLFSRTLHSHQVSAGL